MKKCMSNVIMIKGTTFIFHIETEVEMKSSNNIPHMINSKTTKLLTLLLILSSIFLSNLILEVNAMKTEYNQLTPEEEKVIIDKKTEKPFTGKYNDFFEQGIYVCKRCEAPLFKSDHKFASSCGWPSFDDEIRGAILRIPDKDGRRTEIICSNCNAHLGHVFTGEQLTENNLRHCVNSISIKFIPESELNTEKKAYFAGGCFWGVEHLFEHKPGVVSAASGYMGGDLEHPSYEEVCNFDTGHIETVEVLYNPKEISYENLVKFFFEIHDPTQKNRQGPDVGEQYKSVIFYGNQAEKEIAEDLIYTLKRKRYDVVTELRPSKKFWKAEEYHQDYYDKNNKTPYCHIYKKKF